MGLFDRWFGRKKEADARASNPNGTGAFFLDADDAKTFGNIEYMRTPKTVKKMFPGTDGSKEMVEIEVTVSSMQRISDKAVPIFEPTTFAAEQNGANGDRRRADSSLDLFRHMAKDLKKE
ncbi:MAG: hypothetical protein KME35_22530 [Aphanocapsa sp. GSE-SYN-MK-11-07L]|jgi:Rieske Fe-S protein|nr:hypothetical protein [Aphanocapsa sp. GSE-SYN-MK-11-07L]